MTSRLFYCALHAFFTFAILAVMACNAKGRSTGTATKPVSQPTTLPTISTNTITLFLAGDVMTGRGIDQILPHPGDPRLYEPYIRDARDYVRLAERRHGTIERPVSFDYPWGDALVELQRVVPDARIINLETAITVSDRYRPKGINYRMNPDNVPCITAAKIDCCVLANNHVLDWGPSGLLETLDSLRGAGLRTAGAGKDDASDLVFWIDALRATIAGHARDLAADRLVPVLTHPVRLRGHLETEVVAEEPRHGLDDLARLVGLRVGDPVGLARRLGSARGEQQALGLLHALARQLRLERRVVGRRGFALADVVRAVYAIVV